MLAAAPNPRDHETCAFVIIAIALPLEAQVITGSVTGSVADSTGAVVAGAEVRLTNVETDVVRHAQTDPTGNYRFLPMGLANLLPTVRGIGYLIDGIANDKMIDSGAMTPMTVDATEEFKVQTNAMSAEFGRTGGGVQPDEHADIRHSRTELECRDVRRSHRDGFQSQTERNPVRFACGFLM